MRKPREQSKTDIYHVIIRGVNRHILFEDDEDYKYFINILKIVKKKFSFELYAFCLMDNHAHFLIKAEKSELSEIMKSIQIRYYHWVHSKYDYEGHLCGGRFKSIVVESNAYFQKLMSYIHNNPVKANICKTPKEYAWSSIGYYEANTTGLIDTDKGVSNFGADSAKEVVDYVNKEHQFCLEDYREKKYTDNEAVREIRHIISLFGVSEFCELKDKFLKNAIKKIKKAGITVSQLRRFTGIPFGVLKIQWQGA